MRRSEKEITDPAEIEAIIGTATVIRIAINDTPCPYIVPLNFGYEAGVLYIHSAQKGRKVDLLRQNPHVAFEIDEVGGIVEDESPCEWGATYRSIVGSGRAVFVEDGEAKVRALNLIMNQYAEGEFHFSEASVAATAVYRIDIAEMTGKASG